MIHFDFNYIHSHACSTGTDLLNWKHFGSMWNFPHWKYLYYLLNYINQANFKSQRADFHISSFLRSDSQDINQVTGGFVAHLNVPSRLDSSLQDFSREMFAELSLIALTLLLLQRLRNGAVQVVGCLQLWPEVLQIILANAEMHEVKNLTLCFSTHLVFSKIMHYFL